MAGEYSETERIQPTHDVSDFDCGSDAQTTWLREHALQADGSSDTRVFVVRRLADNHIVGYFALSMGSLLRDSAPERLLKGAGRYPEIPVVLLTRLGVDLTEQGKNVGHSLLLDVFRRVDALSEDVGFRALVVHAETEQAKGFYLSQADFDEGPYDNLQLCILLKDLRAALRE